MLHCFNHHWLSKSYYFIKYFTLNRAITYKWFITKALNFITQIKINIMEVITIETKAFQQIVNSISELKEILIRKARQNPLSDTWLDVAETCILLKISKRTLQKYRDNGVLPFSQISGKIYFPASDIEEHLKKHYNKVYNLK